MILCLSHDFARDELQHLRVDLVLFEVDGGHAVLLREKVGDLAVGDVAELRERRSRGCGRCVAARLVLVVSCCRLISFSRTSSSPKRFTFDMQLPCLSRVGAQNLRGRSAGRCIPARAGEPSPDSPKQVYVTAPFPSSSRMVRLTRAILP